MSFLLGLYVAGMYIAGGKMFKPFQGSWGWTLLWFASPIAVPLALMFLLVVY